VNNVTAPRHKSICALKACPTNTANFPKKSNPKIIKNTVKKLNTTGAILHAANI
jgi:hypothetical protein